MSVFKRFAIFAAVFVTVSSMAMAQAPGRQLTVEESYLQMTIELMIIREQSRAPSRDMKLVALEYIASVIERGNQGEEIHASLAFLGLEGIQNFTRENGRLVNNFPDVRLRAATQLGHLGTLEARDTLLTMLWAENDPMVISEIIRGLGLIGNNDNDQAAIAISFIVSRFDVINPDNLMAFSALDAFERLAAAEGGIASPIMLTTIIRIAEGNYILPVRNRARALLTDLRMLNVGRN
jgi:hypothetical protein